MAIRISVQMCTYNRKHLLGRALEALFHQNFPRDEYEILLVDDGSTDGTEEYVRSLAAPCRLTYLWQEHRGFGLARGRNLGIRKARGPIVLFVDDDIVASPNLLAEHVATHHKHLDHVVRGWVNHVNDLDNIRGPRFNMEDISTAFFWTSNVSAMRKHLLQAGLFDEEFNEYGWEDLELGMRLKDLGLEMTFNKRAVVYHFKARWKAADVPKLCRQAEAKARTALMFVDKQPTWRVRLATGLHGPRLWAHRVFSLGGRVSAFYQKVLAAQGDRVLSGFALFCVDVLFPAASPHFGQRAQHELYYRKRRILGVDLRYEGSRALVADWGSDGDLAVKARIPETMAVGDPLGVEVDDGTTTVAMTGTITRIGGDWFLVGVSPGERARVTDLVARALAGGDRPGRRWVRVDAERLIANLYWRGESFYSGGEIWDRREPDAQTVFHELNDVDHKKLTAYLGARKGQGRKFWVVTERGHLAGFRNLLPSQEAKATFREEDDSASAFFALASFTL